MAGLGIQRGWPLTHQLLGHERMQHRGLLMQMTDLIVLTLMVGSRRAVPPVTVCGVPSSTGAAASALTSCMPCSFSLLPHLRSGSGAQLDRPAGVTLSVRWIPLATAAYGTWVARPAITTTLAPGSDGAPARPEGRPGGDHHSLAGHGSPMCHSHIICGYGR